MQNKKQSFSLMAVLMLICICFITLSIPASALPYDLCGSETGVYAPCVFVTPTLECTDYTYNLTKVSDDESTIINGSLTYFNHSTYYFNFTQDEGAYIAVLCDGTTREIISKPKCEVRNDFEEGLMWICIGMIFVSILMFFFNLFQKAKEEFRGGSL